LYVFVILDVPELSVRRTPIKSITENHTTTFKEAFLSIEV